MNRDESSSGLVRSNGCMGPSSLRPGSGETTRSVFRVRHSSSKVSQRHSYSSLREFPKGKEWQKVPRGLDMAHFKSWILARSLVAPAGSPDWSRNSAVAEASKSSALEGESRIYGEDPMIGWKSVLGTCLGIVAFATLLYSQTPQVVAVRAGRLFDSKSGQLLTRQVVLIQGDLIRQVGSEDQVKVSPGAQVIDLSQATVLPGLIDGHSHVYDSLTAGGRVNTSKEAWTLLPLKEAQTN